MNYNLLMVLIFVLVLVVYLTKLHPKMLKAFGLFLERVFNSWPITKAIELLIKKVDYQMEKLKRNKIENKTTED